MSKNVIVIDLEMGNIGSIRSALEREGCNVQLLKYPPSENPNETYTHCVLPGVGSFNEGSNTLKARGWLKWIQDDWVGLEKPFMGICLGMQLMSEKGCEGMEEGVYAEGLSIVSGSVRLMRAKEHGQSLPHIGWNTVTFIESGEGYVNGDFYFVHSYSMEGVPIKNILGSVIYGEEVVAAIKKGNSIGYQFHPEKSQKNGAYLIRKFIEMGSC